MTTFATGGNDMFTLGSVGAAALALGLAWHRVETWRPPMTPPPSSVSPMTVDEEVVMSAHRYRKVALVWAERTTTSGRIETPEGVMEYAAGDYLVADSPPTHIWPVRRDIFERTYEPVAPSAVALERELEEFADVRARFGEPD